MEKIFATAGELGSEAVIFYHVAKTATSMSEADGGGEPSLDGFIDREKGCGIDKALLLEGLGAQEAAAKNPMRAAAFFFEVERQMRRPVEVGESGREQRKRA
jgi:hypothetical protein